MEISLIYSSTPWTSFQRAVVGALVSNARSWDAWHMRPYNLLTSNNFEAPSIRSRIIQANCLFVMSGLILMLVASSFAETSDFVRVRQLPDRTSPDKPEDKSSFVTQASPETEPAEERELRDPFWPVGFKSKEEEKDNDVMQGVPTNWPVLKMKGITKASDGSYIAMLEKIGMVEAGDIIRIKRDNVIYSWKINVITRKGITYEKLEVKPVKE